MIQIARTTPQASASTSKIEGDGNYTHRHTALLPPLYGIATYHAENPSTLAELPLTILYWVWQTQQLTQFPAGAEALAAYSSVKVMLVDTESVSLKLLSHKLSP